ncbi:DgyrCDS1353 [Dimorphilus gyrociliatus]|uniref:DgyrCDS1353 n=1 Tax=Dimorphilus gyrociliatus TaxID=2664684 RepID=A0A7I8V951_9ANNE|nr:DgyrCDS1353 [Dimorphilus gyrociliatus]
MFKLKKRFGRKSDHKESEARQNLQKELFEYVQCLFHGFPSKPSALAYDPNLKLLAIGTRSGHPIRIYGNTGVEFTSEYIEDFNVVDVMFLEDEARLLVRTEDNKLHMMEINLELSTVDLKQSFESDDELDKLFTCMEVPKSKNEIFLGSSAGNVYVLNRINFEVKYIIEQTNITKNKSEEFKVAPGYIESLKIQPGNDKNLLIGYERGLVVLYDLENSTPIITYNAEKELGCMQWLPKGENFITGHSDGSYSTWTIENNTPLKDKEGVFGPFPCKGILNIIRTEGSDKDCLLIFNGGLPRASYGDRNAVTIQRGVETITLDLTSKVIDFELIYNTEGEPDTLIILAEEELVAVDLLSENWPEFRLPYLNSMHCSAITSITHTDYVPHDFMEKIAQLGETCFTGYSQRTWPVTGGVSQTNDLSDKSLLLTGHEDGSVRFWDTSSSTLKLLYKLSTHQLFDINFGVVHDNNQIEEEWPKFRKTGLFDPYSDDPRLSIQKLALDVHEEMLSLGLTAGQIFVLKLNSEEISQTVTINEIHIVSEGDTFVWKGHEALTMKRDLVEGPGFQVKSVVQIFPPAACTSLALQADWGIVGAGTAHGFCAFDYINKKVLASKTTLSPADLEMSSEGVTSRRKSFKKSLRESFRRLRRRRSEKKSKKKAHDERRDPQSTGSGENNPSDSPERVKSIERSVEARKDEDTLNSMVRSIYFARTFLIHSSEHAPTMWVGTNGGTIYAYRITMPEKEKREEQDLDMTLVKEIQLQHKAPVLALIVIDKTASPLPCEGEVKRGIYKEPDMTGDHSLVVASEEQFKIFTLPHLKGHKKFKLTANEGSKIRKVGFVDFKSRSDEHYKETELVCLTNQGDVQVFTIPHLKRQLKADAVKKENVAGIASCTFSAIGHGFFLNSPSEFLRFSLSARYPHKSMSTLQLQDGIRPQIDSSTPMTNGHEESNQNGVEHEEESPVKPEKPETPESPEKEKQVEDIDKLKLDVQSIEKNDSVLSGSTVNDSAISTGMEDITIDSVKVHVSEEIVKEQNTFKKETTTVISESVKEATV